MAHKEVKRLHQSGGHRICTAGGDKAMHILMHGMDMKSVGSGPQHTKPATSRVPKGSVNDFRAPHKEGGMTAHCGGAMAHKAGRPVRIHHREGGESMGGRETHGFGGSIIGALAHLLPFKEGGRVTHEHMEALRQNPHLIKQIQKRHAELSSRSMSHHERREHHFLGSIINGLKSAWNFAKPHLGSIAKAILPHAAKAAGPLVNKGLEAIGNRMPEKVKVVGRAALPYARQGVQALEQRSPAFKRGMGMAREGAHAMSVPMPLKKGGKARSKHAAGAIAKKRLDQY